MKKKRKKEKVRKKKTYQNVRKVVSVADSSLFINRKSNVHLIRASQTRASSTIKLCKVVSGRWVPSRTGKSARRNTRRNCCCNNGTTSTDGEWGEAPKLPHSAINRSGHLHLINSIRNGTTSNLVAGPNVSNCRRQIRGTHSLFEALHISM